MDEFVTFEGTVEPMPWGDSTFKVLRIPAEVMKALGGPKRVEGEINDHPVNLAPQKAPAIDGHFLWAGKSLLDEIGIAPGDPLEVRLRAADPDLVEVPPDVRNALRSAGMIDAWEALTPGKRRGLLHGINTAKRAETRAKRIGALILGLGKSA